MKTFNALQPQACAVILLLLCSGNNLLAQSKDNQAPGKRTRSNALLHSGKISHNLPLNAISASSLLDSSRVHQNPVKLSLSGGDRLLSADSLVHRLGVALKAEGTSGNWNRIFTSSLAKNQN